MRALAFAVLSGCGWAIGIDDFSTIDAVTGTSIVTYYTETGSQDAPEDLSGLEISAYVVDAAAPGGMRVYPGSGTADGTFAIPAVPVGRYFLRLRGASDSDRIFDVTGRTLDLGFTRTARPDAGLAVLVPSPVDVSGTNMTPFVGGDAIAVYTAATGRESVATFSANTPAVGADSLAQARFDWSGRPLLHDDVLWVVHRSTAASATDGTTTTDAADALYAPGLVQAAGTPLPVSGTFQPGTPHTVTVAVDIAAMRAATDLDWTHDSATAQVSAVPDQGAATLDGSLILDFDYIPKPGAPNATHTVKFRDPFPAGWSRFSRVTYSRAGRAIKLPGSLTATPLVTLVFADRGVESGALTSVGSVSPGTMGVVAHIRVDGTDPADSVLPPRDQPLAVAWDPVPTAASYTVTVDKVVVDGPRTVRLPVVTLSTAQAETALPPDVFADHTRYFVQIAALSRPLEPGLRRARLDNRTSTTPSPMWLVSSTCGNGVVDSSEECDTGGPSATCDFDCTFAVCLDGVTNPAALEQCDNGIAEGTCDGACQRVPAARR